MWFVPFVYFVVALCILPLTRRAPAVIVLLGSGLGYELGMFPIAQTPDYRYSHWLVVSTIAAVVMLFARRWGLAPPVGQSPPGSTYGRASR